MCLCIHWVVHNTKQHPFLIHAGSVCTICVIFSIHSSMTDWPTIAIQSSPLIGTKLYRFIIATFPLVSFSMHTNCTQIALYKLPHAITHARTHTHHHPHPRARAHTHTHTHTHTHKHTHTHTRRHTHAHTHTQTHTHTHSHAHAHKHVHTQSFFKAGPSTHTPGPTPLNRTISSGLATTTPPSAHHVHTTGNPTPPQPSPPPAPHNCGNLPPNVTMGMEAAGELRVYMCANVCVATYRRCSSSTCTCKAINRF